ncbi:Ig-like domain-containing protein [Frigoribacterium faeni]|uniref:Ig-like domain-containing protein n=1 Tax=Frigoribacterium faeni TaxID=145483 RepID=UPI00141B5C13|nr:Ig-like domain-containing protein [Frigoribacterium faeni]NIJ05828.1 hypothetical protein [Frigoribacterium faeni]
MKTTLRRAGALGLAAATIVTGLTVGTSPASAVDAPPTSPSATIKLVFKDGAQYRAVDGSYGRGQTPYPTLAEAQAGAVALTPIKLSNGYFQLTGVSSLGTDSCWSMTAEGFRVNWYSMTEEVCAKPGIASQWYYDGTTLRNAAVPTQQIGAVQEGPPRQVYLAFSSTNSFPLQTDASALLTLTARVDSVDVAARSARISGSGKPGSYIVVDGRDQVQVSPAGTWNYHLTGLALGSNRVPLEQWENGVKSAETALAVALEVAGVTATASFPGDRNQDAVLSGGAQPGATVVVTDAAGTELARTTALTGSGRWSTGIPAPGAGGDRTVLVHQELDGEPNGQISVTVPYGAAVSITSPVPDLGHDGGRLPTSGRGEAGATVAVREQGTQNVIGTATVLASGAWNTTVTLDDRKHVLEATQTGKGANVTRATVTINPDDDGVSQPFALVSPTNGQTVVAPNDEVAFTGRGTTGDTVQIVNTYNGRVIDTATVRSDGTWSARGSVGPGVQNLTALVTHRGTVTDNPFTIIVRSTPGADEPFAITAPADGSLVIAPDYHVTFTGTGSTGATVEMKAGNGRQVMKTTVRDDGSWTAVGELGHQRYTLDVIYTPAGGTPVTTTYTITVQPGAAGT